MLFHKEGKGLSPEGELDFKVGSVGELSKNIPFEGHEILEMIQIVGLEEF